MREAAAAPKSRWQRLGILIGLLEDDDLLGERKPPLLGGLTRRLAYLTAGAAVGRVLGEMALPWVGLAVLAVWILPLLCHIAFRIMAVVAGAFFLSLARGLESVNWHRRIRDDVVLFGYYVGTMLELVVVILSFAWLGGWLLEAAVGP
jgi:hypothetical protein